VETGVVGEVRGNCSAHVEAALDKPEYRKLYKDKSKERRAAMKLDVHTLAMTSVVFRPWKRKLFQMFIEKWTALEPDVVARWRNESGAVWNKSLPATRVEERLPDARRGCVWRVRLVQSRAKSVMIRPRRSAGRYIDDPRKNEWTMMDTIPMLPNQQQALERMNGVYKEEATNYQQRPLDKWYHDNKEWVGPKSLSFAHFMVAKKLDLDDFRKAQICLETRQFDIVLKKALPIVTSPFEAASMVDCIIILGNQSVSQILKVHGDDRAQFDYYAKLFINSMMVFITETDEAKAARTWDFDNISFLATRVAHVLYPNTRPHAPTSVCCYTRAQNEHEGRYLHALH